MTRRKPSSRDRAAKMGLECLRDEVVETRDTSKATAPVLPTHLRPLKTFLEVPGEDTITNVMGRGRSSFQTLCCTYDTIIFP